jgi:hypothetical protein
MHSSSRQGVATSRSTSKWPGGVICTSFRTVDSVDSMFIGSVSADVFEIIRKILALLAQSFVSYQFL